MKRLVIATLMIAGCSNSGRNEPSEIFSHAERGYSVGQPRGWTASEDNGATRFSAPAGKQTIVVRSAPRPREIIEGKQTTNEDVVDATRAALQRLTRERIAEAASIDDGELPGARFSFTYRPQSTQRPYRRTHVVLFGVSRLFHVIQTSPLGEKPDDEAMQEMVATLREEG